MLLNLLKSKIHRATVTEANLEYEGSITLDQSLMEAAGLVENERVDIWNVTRGTRLSTYVMAPAEPGSGVVCINGAAAHHMSVNDIVIIASFVLVDAKEAKTHKPLKVIVNPKNQVKIVKHV